MHEIEVEMKCFCESEPPIQNFTEPNDNLLCDWATIYTES